jgi:glycosyltransferase involved in cell wall biosynthesis
VKISATIITYNEESNLSRTLASVTPLVRDGKGEIIVVDSGSTDRTRVVCDEALHLVSPAGLAVCDGCGKPFCRACYPERCPKCGHAEERLSLGSIA